MKKIPLTKGKFAMVDDEDFERVNQFKWCVGARGYAVRSVRINGKKKYYSMHRMIVNASGDDEVDHKDLNRLNNQKDNLRVCTPSQNMQNRPAPKNNTSGYKGVHWNTRQGKFKAQINYKGKRIHLGYFLTVEDGSNAYKCAAVFYHGEFANW